MAYEERPGSGTLFKNTKGDSDKAPSMTGYITAHRDLKAGEKVRLAGWKKGGQNGKDPFLSLKMSDDRQAEKPARQTNEDPF